MGINSREEGMKGREEGGPGFDGSKFLFNPGKDRFNRRYLASVGEGGSFL